jgi:hypothetical protein
VFVIFGSATAASAALFLFPWLASVSLHGKRKKVEPKEIEGDIRLIFLALRSICLTAR